MHVATLVLTAFLCGSCGDAACHRFRRDAERLNSQCPLNVGNGITLDSVRFDGTSLTLGYFYTLSGEADDAVYMTVRHDSLKHALDEALANATELESYRQAGIAMYYRYRSASTGKTLAEFIFNLSQSTAPAD